MELLLKINKNIFYFYLDEINTEKIYNDEINTFQILLRLQTYFTCILVNRKKIFVIYDH